MHLNYELLLLKSMWLNESGAKIFETWDKLVDYLLYENGSFPSQVQQRWKRVDC